jgi:hypothetical protein
MGKKIQEAMDAERPKFLAGAAENGVDEGKALEVWNLLDKFANYGFNKSHAAAYAVVSYQTAWLKANHPVEFMAAVMNCDIHLTDKLNVYKREVDRMGIEVVPPCVNRSGAVFSVAEGQIVYALGALKNVGSRRCGCLAAGREAGRGTGGDRVLPVGPSAGGLREAAGQGGGQDPARADPGGGGRPGRGPDRRCRGRPARAQIGPRQPLCLRPAVRPDRALRGHGVRRHAGRGARRSGTRRAGGADGRGRDGGRSVEAAGPGGAARRPRHRRPGAGRAAGLCRRGNGAGTDRGCVGSGPRRLRPLEVTEVNLDGPRAGEVLVEIKATGICHTDEFTRSGADPEGLFPAILGHEGAGVVLEVGEGVTS